tara:strand:+ start:1118 stop:1867 length:750 start_codon:yes stop_codon:yes gene_type:complete
LIKALLTRRAWLFRNRLIPNLFIYFLLPFTIFAMIGLPLKNIIRFSITKVPYDVWVFPGLIFILSSILIFPSLYREFFTLRFHGNALANITLSPHRKINIIFSNLIASILESIIFSILTSLIYIYITKMIFNLLNIFFLLVCLVIFLLLVGNLFITIFLILDTLSIVLLSSGIIYLYIIFGNGLIIETSFFPNGISEILEIMPFSLVFKQFQIFNSIGIINFQIFIILLTLIYFWILLNGFLLKRKMSQ